MSEGQEDGTEKGCNNSEFAKQLGVRVSGFLIKSCTLKKTSCIRVTRMLYNAIKEAKTMYTVKEVADILGVSVHTVRYYDDQGLIPGTKRDSYNQRIFDDMELEWLFVSISLRDTGLPLKEIKRYIELYQQGDSTLQQRFDIMSKQRAKVLEEMENLKLRIKVLDRKVDHYAKLLAGKEDEWNHEYMQKLIWKGREKNGK